MNPRELLVLLARFTVTGYGGLVGLTCDRCGTPRTFGADGEPIAFTEVFVYARDHDCRPRQVLSQRRARELAAI